MRVALALFLVISAAAPGAWAQLSNFETVQTRKASELLSPDVIEGKNYRVEETVAFHGYFNVYRIESDFGAFEAVGDANLRKVLREIRAIAGLREEGSFEAAAKAGFGTIINPLEGIYRLLTKPVATLKGIPLGAHRLVVEGVEGLSRERTEYEDTDMQALLGVSHYKRDYAAQHDVDVYSSNPVLQSELDRLGYASLPGWVIGSIASVPIGGPAASALSTTEWLNDSLEQHAPLDLHLDNLKKIKAWGVSENDALQFLTNRFFSPRHQTVLVNSLDLLVEAKGRGRFLAIVGNATNEADALFYQRIAEIFRAYREQNGPIVGFRRLNRIPVGLTAKKTLLVGAPFDYVIWNEPIAAAMQTLNAAGFEASAIELWVTGKVSERARNELAKEGVSIRDNLDSSLHLMD